MAARRTVAKLGARKIATTALPVLFEARVAASLIGRRTPLIVLDIRHYHAENGRDATFRSADCRAPDDQGGGRLKTAYNQQSLHE